MISTFDIAGVTEKAGGRIIKTNKTDNTGANFKKRIILILHNKVFGSILNGKKITIEIVLKNKFRMILFFS